MYYSDRIYVDNDINNCMYIYIYIVCIYVDNVYILYIYIHRYSIHYYNIIGKSEIQVEDICDIHTMNEHNPLTMSIHYV